MTRRRRTIILATLAGLAVLALASPDHRADIRILTHEADDTAPQKMQAAVDLGPIAVSVLVTWSKRFAAPSERY